MATITEDYVSFETAKLLKEKGFDCETDMYYSPEGKLKCWIPNGLKSWLDNRGNETWWWKCVAPTLQMAIKWLREVHNIHIVIKSVIRTYGDTEYYYELYGTKDKSLCVVCDIYKGESWDSSEEACEAAIKYSLEELI